MLYFDSDLSRLRPVGSRACGVNDTNKIMGAAKRLLVWIDFSDRLSIKYGADIFNNELFALTGEWRASAFGATPFQDTSMR